MSDAEMVRFIAEKIMGWTIVEFSDEDRKRDIVPRLIQQCAPDREEKRWLLAEKLSPIRGRLWNPLDSIADAIEAEGKLPDYRWERYLRALCVELAGADPFTCIQAVGFVWLMMIRRAAPSQICTALVAAMEEK